MIRSGASCTMLLEAAGRTAVPLPDYRPEKATSGRSGQENRLRPFCQSARKSRPTLENDAAATLRSPALTDPLMMMPDRPATGVAIPAVAATISAIVGACGRRGSPGYRRVPGPPDAFHCRGRSGRFPASDCQGAFRCRGAFLDLLADLGRLGQKPLPRRRPRRSMRPQSQLVMRILFS